jgi:hypothetical protein
MFTSPEEMQALKRVAELEPPLTALEDCLTALAQALRNDDARAIEQQANELHRALARAMASFTRAAREGGAPGRGFGPAADSLSLRVQRKEAKKAPRKQHPRLVGCDPLAALGPVVTRCSRKGLLDSPRLFTAEASRGWVTLDHQPSACRGSCACAAAGGPA